MKTLVLSADDIQQFTKLIYDQQKTAAAIAAVSQMEQSHMLNSNVSAYTSVQQQQQQHQQQQPPLFQQQLHSQQQLPAAHIMSLQYYLKHPSAAAVAANTAASNGNSINYPTTVIPSHHQQHLINQQQQQQQQQQQLHHLNLSHKPNTQSLAVHQTQQQQQLQQHQPPQQQKQQQVHQRHSTPHTPNLRLKQPNGSTSNSSIHHQLPSGYHTHQHHPYYNGTTTVQNNSNNAATHVLPHIVSSMMPATTAATNNRQHSTNALPVHALNQNSNFSAASSSTGGGTNSSHAPTQQSNTTGPSLSPPAAVSANPRTQSHANTKSAANSALITPPPRYTIVKSSSNIAATNTTSTTLPNSILATKSNSAGGGGNTKKIRTEPVLSQLYQSERLNFANSHLTWSQEHWRRLLFQDERKFNLDGPDGYSNYYHDLRNYERTLSQRPRGISVYVYLLVTAAGPIHLEVSTSKVGAESVIDTLLRQRSNIIAKLGGNMDFLLQDHNWTTNALPAAQELLNAEGIKTQKWPTIAHDINIMENVWGWIIREVYDGGRMFSRKDDLIFRIREAWARLPMDLIRNLYSTLPERISELYLTRGAYTNC